MCWFLIGCSLLLVVANGYKELEIPDCLSLTSYGENFCNEQTHGWCEWNDDHSICQSTKSVNVDAIFIDYYELASNPFYLIAIPCAYCIIFMISKLVATYLFSIKDISPALSEKCVVYVFEVFASIPIIIRIFYPIFVYDPIFRPKKYNHVTPETYKQLFGSITFIGGALTSTYLIEMVYQRNMRFRLQLHHWTTIFAGYYTFLCLVVVCVLCPLFASFFFVMFGCFV